MMTTYYDLCLDVPAKPHTVTDLQQPWLDHKVCDTGIKGV